MSKNIYNIYKSTFYNGVAFSSGSNVKIIAPIWSDKADAPEIRDKTRDNNRRQTNQ